MERPLSSADEPHSNPASGKHALSDRLDLQWKGKTVPSVTPPEKKQVQSRIKG